MEPWWVISSKLRQEASEAVDVWGWEGRGRGKGKEGRRGELHHSCFGKRH